MDLLQFLVIAKTSTYAAGGEAFERNLEDDSKVFTYEDKQSGFKYIDRYFGFNPFGGEEIVWKGNRPV
jgi:hypothetical protein